MNDARTLTAEVAVVGAGLAGLAAATVAARAGASVVQLDVRSPGGRARSDERDGYIFNQGPRGLFRAGPGAGVLDRLGVTFQGSLPHSAVAGYRESTDVLAVLPTSSGSLLRSPLMGVGDKIRLGRLLASLRKVEAAPLAPLSAAGWIDSLGLTSRGGAVLSAITRVVTYAADLCQISADASVRQLQLFLEGNVLYLDGGWQALVDGLGTAASAAGVRLLAGERVTAIDTTQEQTWGVTTPVRTVRASSVVIAAGGPDMARALLPSRPAWEVGPPATAACLDLGLRRLPTTKVAFGLDQPLYFSTHGPNARLAPADGVLVHVMRYGARTSAVDRSELWSLAERCGVAAQDVVVERFLHEMTVCHALPQPGEGLGGRPRVTATGGPGLFVAGDWVGSVGLLADAALSSGEAAGRAAASWAKDVAPSVSGMVRR